MSEDKANRVCFQCRNSLDVFDDETRLVDVEPMLMGGKAPWRCESCRRLFCTPCLGEVFLITSKGLFSSPRRRFSAFDYMSGKAVAICPSCGEKAVRRAVG
jgi:hypothetical protein